MPFSIVKYKKSAEPLSPIRLAEFEEVIGDFHNIEEKDGVCIAHIEKIGVLVPVEFRENLLGLKGHRVSILNLDGVHFRDRTAEEGA